MARTPKLSGLTFNWMDFPEDVIVETNAHCNLRCIMCPYPFLKRPKGEMDFEVFAKIVDEVAQESPTSRLWVAILGEPLLGKNLVPMLRYAKNKGIKHINLNTNATFLTPKITYKLLDCGIENLLVSLDATTKETYDQIRVKGDFPTVVRNVENFLAEKQRLGLKLPNVIAQFIIMDQNEKEIEDFKSHWLSRGAVVKLRLKMGWGTAVTAEDLQVAAVKRDFPCAWLLRSVSIHWDGQFAQCDADYEATNSPGNIKTQPIKEIWDHELATRRKRTLALDFSNPPCDTCLDWSVGRAEFFYPEENS
jgi:radical SAM protein with 4Fe4S-binding SPASM domain